MSRPVKTSRRYDSAGRQEQARQTRRDVLAAAKGLFLERGFAATTMADVAAGAGVAVQTVYSAVGGKTALLKAVFDTTLVGDDEPVAVSGRPEIARVSAETDGRRKLELFARYVSGVHQRLSPLVPVLQAAADADEDAARLWEGYYRGKYEGMTNFAANLKEQRLLRRGMTVERAAAVLAAHIDVINWQNLVERQGFTTRDFEAWLVDVTAAAILRP
jgi:TetR/AcrR family transcriptional regulator, regulator of autoinduction and epiphytic fitness